MALISGLDNVMMQLVLYVILAISAVVFVQIIAYSTITASHHKKSKRKKKFYPLWSRRLVNYLDGKDNIKSIELKRGERKPFRDMIISFYTGEPEEGVPYEVMSRCRLLDSKKRKLRMLYRDLGFIEDDLDYLRSGSWFQKTVAFGRLARLELNEGEDIALDLITSSDKELALSAISYLTTIESRYLSEHLSSIYQWNDPALHKEITLELLKMRLDPGSIKELTTDPYPAVRKAAAMLSGSKGNQGSLSYLKKLMKDDDDSVRQETARALGSIGGKRSHRMLEIMVDDPDKEVRSTVAEALGKSGSSGAINTLERLARDDDRDVRVMAFTNLSRKGWEGRAALIGLSASDPETGKEFV
jgi:hypothetical protein